MEKIGKLIDGSIHETKTAAGHFAKGYRGSRFGKTAKPRGSIKVGPVGKFWGVFDHDPELGRDYITIQEGIEQGKLYQRLKTEYREKSYPRRTRITPKRPRISR